MPRPAAFSVVILSSFAAVAGFICLAQPTSASTFTTDEQKAEVTAEPISIILLLKAPRALKAEQVAKACQLATDRPFAVAAKGNTKPDSVSVHDAGFLIQTKELQAALTISNKPWDHQLETEDIESAAIRTMLKEQRAVIELSVISESSASAANASTRDASTKQLCRIAAALCGKDVAGLAIPSQEILVACADELPSLLNSLNPIRALQTGVAEAVVGTSDGDPELSKATAEAKKRWSEFAKAFESRNKGTEGFAAQFVFDAAEGQRESLWIEVVKIDADRVLGKVANEPQHVALKLGESVTVPLNKLKDWLYYRDGERVGGFTVEVLLKRESQKSEPGKR